MHKAQLTQPSAPQVKTPEPTTTKTQIGWGGFVHIYRLGITPEEMGAWVPGHLRTLQGPEAYNYAAKHPYNDTLVYELQQQFIADWLKGAGDHTNIAVAVIDVQFKRALLVLDDLRLAGWDVMVRKIDG